MYTEEALEKIRLVTENLGEKLKQNDILDELDHFVAIMVTAGNPNANDLLTMSLNKLRQAVNPQYPYEFQTPEKITMYSNMAIEALKLAVSKHWQSKETLSDEIKANAFKTQAFIGEPQVLHQKLTRRFQKRIEYSDD